VTAKPEVYVLDTSAILTLWNDEDGAPVVEKILHESTHRGKIYVSFMTFMECKYRVWREHGRSLAEELIRSLSFLPLIRVDVDDDLLMAASELKAQYKISVADSWILATAITRNAVLVHKDPEFDALTDRVPVKRLPYKRVR
jgi:predicted nucleic acid-binding protein